MRLVVVTEYCKSMSSQSGRQSQSDSVVLLICLRNSWALLALRKGFCNTGQHFVPLPYEQRLRHLHAPFASSGFWGRYLLNAFQTRLPSWTDHICTVYSQNSLHTFLLILWPDHTITHHGRQSAVARASLIPHSNRQLEWEYLWGIQSC